jgi:hypothetical protein
MAMNVDDFTDDDTLLSAWLDGELPADQADAVTERLAAEPELAARLQALRAADTRFASAYASLADEPVPAHIAALLSDSGSLGERGESLSGSITGSDTGVHDETMGTNVVPFRRRFVSQLLTVPTAMAAGIALAFGFLLAFVLAPQVRDSSGTGLASVAALISPDDPLYRVLEHSPGGTATELVEGRHAVARLSFQGLDGDFCRQLDVGDARGTTTALVCRREEGWRVELAGFHDVPLITGDDAVYRPASGPTATLFDLAVDELIDGDVLSADEERALIAQGWRTPD